jgi:hypothetical protein
MELKQETKKTDINLGTKRKWVRALRLQRPSLKTDPEDEDKSYPILSYIEDRGQGSAIQRHTPCTVAVYKNAIGAGVRGAKYPEAYDMLSSEAAHTHEFMVGINENGVVVSVHVIKLFNKLAHNMKVDGEEDAKNAPVELTYIEPTESLYVRQTPRGMSLSEIRGLLQALSKKDTLQPGDTVKNFEVSNIDGPYITMSRLKSPGDEPVRY